MGASKNMTGLIRISIQPLINMSKIIDTILIVGLGSIGKRHVEIISQAFPQVHIVVYRHRSCDSIQDDSLPIRHCTSSLDEAIAFKPQLAIIANPATKHVIIAKKLAIHGIDLMIEKPISNNYQDSLELIDVCRQHNALLTVAYNLRFLPSLIHFKQCVELKMVGDIYAVRSEVGQYLPSWRPESDYRNGVSARKDMGGGVLLELSHEIDYLRWIFGKVDWVQAHASRQSHLEIDVEDSASIILGMERSVGSDLIASLNMDFIRHDTTRRCYAIGEKGTLMWDAISGEVKKFPQGGESWEVLSQSLPDRNYTYTQEIASFFEAVESRGDLAISAKDGVEVVRVIEAIKESSRKGKKVHL